MALGFIPYYYMNNPKAYYNNISSSSALETKFFNLSSKFRVAFHFRFE